ncbi:ATP-binding protein [Actinacidiphila rubida]|uniref:Histidine kinase-like ATPase domain-containing protein n=1 Tax=Actinacidiphila rubida TaxID=310780 RepID=A0A1H8DH87_9ACTN|nr:ATP-binding protein [Actinacidiphila rubida]SEN06134.1 Histidine kinase-like ATPase domain-containing protein [Actinacidiphila rubida]
MTLKSPPTAVVHELAADPAAFTGVRRRTRAQLCAWGRTDLAEAAELCVTELLANVHRHVASSACELRLERLPGGGVRVTVADRSHVVPVPRPEPGATEERGRGLLLIAAVSARWGTTLTATGKQVWVELR